MKNVTRMFYKLLYIGVPISERDFEDVDVDFRSALADGGLSNKLATEFMRVRRDKISFNRELQKKKRELNKKLRNPLTIFSKKRNQLKDRLKLVLDELLIADVEKVNTKKAYIDSRRVVSGMESKIKSLYKIENSDLNEIESLFYNLVDAQFDSLEDIEDHYDNLMHTYLSERYAEITNDSTYYYVDYVCYKGGINALF